MMPSATMIAIAIALLLCGCSASMPEAMPPLAATTVIGSDTLHTPSRVVPGRLEYAPDGSTFAPLLTERFPYPTQSDANAAYLRLVGPATQSGTASSSIRLFGCKPGALDGRTARITRYRGPVVHCATDRIDSDGRKLGRDTVNFYYHRAVWVMQPVDPPRAAVSWRDREGSPRDLWWWLPGRARYQ